MKYNIGDLFVSCNGGSVRYIESIVKTSHVATYCLYNMTHIDEMLKCRFPNVTEINIDIWLRDGAWKHFPAKQ